MKPATTVAILSLLVGVSRLPIVASAAADQIPKKIYAQRLVDEVVKKHPEVLVLAMHVTPPNSPDNVIIASNIGRIGKKADEDDLRVIRTGQPIVEVNKTGDRFEVELPLQDVAGNTIGALGVVFPYKSGDDKAALQAKAEKIRDGLRRHISHVANLFDPAQFDPRIRTDTYAQKLVDETLAKHTDLLILVMHVTPPNRSDNVIIASNIGRIGKKADEDDLKVIQTGKPNLEVNATGDRFEVELVLQDSFRKTIGALATVFPYKPGDDKVGFHKRAEKIRDELRKEIPTLAKLFDPAH